MSKRPDTKQTLFLALELLKRIPRRRKISARELHEQLPDDVARDLRTVQRQLDMLSQAFEIERDDSSKPYGYRWKERAEGLSLPRLTEQESLLLALAEEHLRHLLPAAVIKSFSSFFAQARRTLGPAGPGELQAREWLGKVRVVRETQPLLPPRISTAVFDAVSDALYSNKWLTVDYKNAAGQLHTSEVMPLGLAQQGPRLYLVARFRGFENERTLALHRIRKAVATLPFTRPKGFNLSQYDEEGRFGFGEGRRVRLEFVVEKGSGAHLIETPLAMDQTVYEQDGCLKVCATVVESDQLKRWLRGFGAKVRVLKPSGFLND